MRYKNGNDIDENKHVIKGSMTGWVHSTHRIKQGSETLQKVVVRFPHFPGQGDKLANRFAQKGVIGMVVDNRDMPYLERDGSTPDIIFSVTSFASRMTAGMLDEMLRGKAASTCNLNHIIKRLVTIEGGIITRNKDFYIRLTRILIPNVPRLPIVRYDDLEKLSGKEGRPIAAIINERYPNYQEGYGIMFKDETIILEGRVVGHKVTYSVPQRDFIAKLKYGGCGILFSQLDKRRQEQYFYEHQDEIVPTYLIKGAKDYSTFEKLLRDATAFRPLKEEEISEYLLYKGYEPKGMEQAVDGITGRRFRALIFTGPCFYMHLKHLVEKKQQVRDQGSNSLTTRAPVKGRSSGGAVKKEEMTRVVLLAHGATKFLRQSFLTAADKFDHIICRKCGKFCFIDYNASKAICENCPEADPHKVTLPWATIKLAMIMSASGGDVTFTIKDLAGNRSIQNQNVILDDPAIAGNRPRQSLGNKSVNVYHLQEPEGPQREEEVCVPDEEADEIDANLDVNDDEEEGTSEEEMEAEEDRFAGIIHM
jgi:DNA-directed RNA polymerase beta subunit